MSATFLIQLFGTLFGIAMIYFTFIRFKKKELAGSEFFLWLVGWLIFMIIALIPNVLDPVVHTFNFDRRLDFFIVIGFFVLIGLVFHNYIIVNRSHKKLEGVVRKIAMERK